MAKRKAAKRPAGKAKPARKAPKAASRKSARRAATRKSAKRAARPAKKAARATTRKRVAPKKATKRAVPTRKAASRPKAAGARKAGASKKAGATKKAAARTATPRRGAVKAPARKTARKAPKALIARRAPALDRARRTIVDEDIVQTPPSSLDLDRSASAIRTGRQEMKQRYDLHTETSPALTAGDVDADWESAYAVGDEAPGGDNPTPDQDIVDDIGRAVGVQYEDNEELKGATKNSDRDAHRWELDPASAEDYKDRK